MAEMNQEKTMKKLTKRSLPPEIKVSVKAVMDKKGEEILVLDLRGISSFTDYFLLMNGNSSRQNLALYEGVEEELKKVNVRPLSVEGKEHGEWILMDYGSFIVHVFSKQAREYYSLEKLWGDAPKISF
jgi:ribosome-associated protein